MQRDENTDRDDPIAWARAETIAFSKRKAKLYGGLTFINLVAFALVLKGMPAHSLWPYLGLVLGISLVCLLAVTGFYSIAIIGEWIELWTSQRQRH